MTTEAAINDINTQTVSGSIQWNPNSYTYYPYNTTCWKCNGSGAYSINKCGCACNCCKAKAKLCEVCNGTGKANTNYTWPKTTPYWTYPNFGSASVQGTDTQVVCYN